MAVPNKATTQHIKAPLLAAAKIRTSSPCSPTAFTMRFILRSSILASLLTAVSAGLLVDSELSERACSITLCGAADPSVVCCAGLFCSTISVSLLLEIIRRSIIPSPQRCTACGISGGFCGAAGDQVPCCAGLFCSSTEVSAQRFGWKFKLTGGGISDAAPALGKGGFVS
jgi:hypothetical protein